MHVTRVDTRTLWVTFESGCVGCQGCQGACGLAPGREVALPRSLLEAPVAVGDALLLRMPAQRLHHLAARGYGAALLGLFGGACVAASLAAWLLPERDPNAAVLTGALLGTLLALFASKRPNVLLVREGS